MRRFDGKVVVVTGGAAGIGRAIAAAFGDEGARVAVLDVAAPPAGALPPRGIFLHCDVSDESAVQRVMGAVVAELGGIDVLVNNAAAFRYGAVDSATSGDWDVVLSVNVKGVAFCAKHALPAIRARGGGAIVNISSISAFCGQEAFVPYSTTKAAVLQMTRCMAADEGRHGVRVNAVCPGPILTDATAKHAAGLGKTVEQVVEELTGHLVLKRMGRGDEVAKAVLFLASDDASFTTGSHVMVDGGYLLC